MFAGEYAARLTLAPEPTYEPLLARDRSLCRAAGFQSLLSDYVGK